LPSSHTTATVTDSDGEKLTGCSSAKALVRPTPADYDARSAKGIVFPREPPSIKSGHAVPWKETMHDSFRRGSQYTRRDVFRLIGVPENTRGGNWFTGYNEHAGAVYVFANVGVPGRTGHDYRNAWEGANLRRFAKNGTNIRQRQAQRIVDARARVHVFWRTDSDEPFLYAGRGTAIEVKDSSPVEVLWTFD
jgi:hypothetical protein